MPSYKVTLIRNSKIGPRTWEHEGKRGAEDRADALCTLHGLSFACAEWDASTLTYTIDASAYYTDRTPSKE